LNRRPSRKRRKRGEVNRRVFGTDAAFCRYRPDQFRFIFNTKCSPHSDAFRYNESSFGILVTAGSRSYPDQEDIAMSMHAFRRDFITKPIFSWARGVLPAMSDTER